jgi:hypothetical protein
MARKIFNERDEGTLKPEKKQKKEREEEEWNEDAEDEEDELLFEDII